MAMVESNKAEVRILFRRVVQPSCVAGETHRHLQLQLNPWDLRMLSIDYIQKGLLFPPNTDFLDSSNTIDLLLSSFSRALDYFYPLAGRLSTTLYNQHPTPSLSIHLDCNNSGAEFIYATTSDLTAADITSSSSASRDVLIPPAIRSLFPLSGVINHDAHSIPIFAAQITLLADGSLFLACSLNHAVADGSSFWQFFNIWSAFSRSSGVAAVLLPTFEKFFLPSTPPPILLPFRDASEFINREPNPQTREGFFPFSRQNITKLKARANQDMGVTQISSLQALLALVWRAVTKARGFDPDVGTTYVVVVGHQQRVIPPLPKTYFGNTSLGIPAKARARELADNGLGWAAWQLNRAIASGTNEEAVRFLEEWVKKPDMMRKKHFVGPILVTGSSPRFDVYGNDFGWGPPMAVRSGDGNKMDGKVTVYPGREGEGSMDLEICLSSVALNALMGDEEFMDCVGTKK